MPDLPDVFPEPHDRDTQDYDRWLDWIHGPPCASTRNAEREAARRDAQEEYEREQAERAEREKKEEP